jgi:signal transduction histidine kinase
MDFWNIFVRPPGDLPYFLIIATLGLAALAIAFGQRLRYPEDLALQRYSFATVGVVATWVLLLIGALATLLFNIESRLVLPPLERATNQLAILLFAWAFLTADHDRGGRYPTALLGLLMALTNIDYVVSAAQWARIGETVDYAVSLPGIRWTITALVGTGTGALLTVIFFRLVLDAPLKLVFFAVLALSYSITLVQFANGTLTGDYAGVLRIGYIASMAVAVVIVYRTVTARAELLAQNSALLFASQSLAAVQTPPVGSSTSETAPTPVHAPVERESVQLLRVLGLILEDSSPESVPAQIVKISLDVLRADVGALLRIQDANYADITSIYDRLMKRGNSGISLNLDNQPTLVNAVERRTQRPLLVGRNDDELSDLYTRLDISQRGPVYFQPLVHDSELVAVLMIALPYTERELGLQEEEILKGIALIAAGLLSLSYKASEASQLAEERAIQAMVQGVSPNLVGDQDVISARQEMQASLQLAREQISELSKQVMQLKLQLEAERNRISAALEDTQEGLSVSQKLVAISMEQDRLRGERDQLAARLQETEAALSGATASNDTEIINRMVEVLQRERDELIEERARLQTQLDDLRQNSSNGLILPEAMQDVLDRMSAEKARLQHERDELSTRLDDLQSQLSVMGIEGGASGLAYLIGKLYEDRATLRTKNETLTVERNTLLKERQQLEDRIEQERTREKTIRTLQEQVKQLAIDRDTAIKQRDELRKMHHELDAKLDSVKEHRARLLAQVSGYEEELKEAHDDLAKLHRQVQKLSDHISQMIHERDKLTAEKQTLVTERDQLLARIEGDRGRIQQVSQEGLGAMQTMISDLSEQRNTLERELNQARAALAQMQNKLDAAQIRSTTEISSGNGNSGYTTENADLVMGLVQELRTPMTSITGYVDLLLSESAGILGEMQRQFLQRVATNVNRLAMMLDDLIRVTSLDTGKFTITPVALDVVAVIEDAITNASIQFREKGLTVNLELEESLPPLYADRDAFGQIIGQLLTNAYLVSPPNTEVSITALQRSVRLVQDRDEPIHCLYVSVADRGGGILPEDEARVFARKYKAENPLIQGLGDTGVGLAIARALIEAHGGRLWLESQEHVGTVFHFVLPFHPLIEGLAV